ncbi:MAG: hypothetical protein ACMUHX_09900 [bacterium]
MHLRKFSSILEMVVELKIQTISGAANGEPDGGMIYFKCNYTSSVHE